MKAQVRNRYLFLFILIFYITISSGSPRDILNNVSDNYLNSIPFALKFQVKNINDKNEATSQTEGRFIINKANEFRVNYPRENILYDGKWLWTYNKTNQQTVVEEFNPSSTLSLIYDIINGNLDNFKIKSAEENDESWTLNLEPQNKNNFFQRIELIASEERSVVEKAKYVDYRGSKILIDFVERRDTSLQDSAFYDVKEYNEEDLIDLRP